MNDKLKKGLIIGTAGCTLGALSHYLLTKKLMTIAMDRVNPKDRNKGKDRFAGTPEMQQITMLLENAAQQLESKSHDTVETIAHDGISLIGHWYPCESAKRIVIAMHGWRSSWSQDFGLIADFWSNHDCSVLYVEQRGQNNSGGDHMCFGLLERYDCITWANWVNEKTGKQFPIYLAGVSMGATAVLMASELDLPDNVYGIAADSAFTSPHEIWKHVSENNLHIPYALHKPGVDRMCKKRIQINADAASTIDALKQCRVPVLFVHGADDHFVPVEMTYENYKACAALKHLLIVPGADHCMSYLMEKEVYERTAVAFWEACEQQAQNLSIEPERREENV